MPTDLRDLSRLELSELLAAWGFGEQQAARLWRYVYRDGASRFEDMPELPDRLRERLIGEALLSGPVVARQSHSADDATRKYLLSLHDGCQIETVLMRIAGRVTACLSSQAGCAMGCVFCATGQMGFRRQLFTAEIVAQVLYVDRELRLSDSTRRRPGRGTRTERLRNVVLMGMGEPLHNYDAVLKAVDILRDPGGLAIGARHITLSTIGVVPGIIRLADEGQPIRLAVSLHAATQAERAALIPVARTWPLEDLLEACRYYAAKVDQRIFFEWALIAGRNDSQEQAQTLVSVLHGIPAHVNLILLNPTPDYVELPSDEKVAREFQKVLAEGDLPSTIRMRRGIDIAAGCGQLQVERIGARGPGDAYVSSISG